MTKELNTTLQNISLEEIKGYGIDSKQLFLQINLEEHSVLVPYSDKEKLLQDLIELKKYHIKKNETISHSKTNKLKQLFDENRINTDYFYRFIFVANLLVILAGSFTAFKFLLEPFKVYLSVAVMTGVTSILLVSKKMMTKKWKRELRLAESKVTDTFNSSYHQNNVIIKDLETNISLMNMEIKNGIDSLVGAHSTNREDLLRFSIGLKQFLDNTDASPVINESLEEEKRKRFTL